jgi:hypothetical protein
MDWHFRLFWLGGLCSPALVPVDKLGPAQVPGNKADMKFIANTALVDSRKLPPLHPVGELVEAL